MRKHEFEHASVEHTVELKDGGEHVIEAVVTSGEARESVRFEATDLGHQDI